MENNIIDYTKKTVVELKELCKEQNITVISKKKKGDLIDMLKQSNININTDILKIVSKANQTIGADVFIDDLPAPDGIYNYAIHNQYHYSGIKLLIENGKIKERYFIERVKNIVLEKTKEYTAQKGNKVFLDTGIPAPSGKYSLGFMVGKVIVEDGKFVRYE
jgi:hypothetical protein